MIRQRRHRFLWAAIPIATTLAAAVGTASPSIGHACGVSVDGQCIPDGMAFFEETPAGPARAHVDQRA